MLETREREERRAREMSPLLLARAPPAPAPAVSALRKGRREERPDCVCAQRKPGEPPGSEHRDELKSWKLKSSEEQADNLFNVFDGDNSETIDFAEFIMASHATTLRYAFVI